MSLTKKITSLNLQLLSLQNLVHVILLWPKLVCWWILLLSFELLILRAWVVNLWTCIFILIQNGHFMVESTFQLKKFLNTYIFFERQYIQVWKHFQNFRKIFPSGKYCFLHLCLKQFLEYSKKYIAVFRF